jgi:hypothetical protein
VLLLVLGLGLMADPADVPGLTLPDSPQAMRAMQQMEGGSMSGDANDDDAMPMNEAGPDMMH